MHIKHIFSCYFFLDIHYNIGVNQLFAQDISLLKIHHNTVLIVLYALPERAVYA